MLAQKLPFPTERCGIWSFSSASISSPRSGHLCFLSWEERVPLQQGCCQAHRAVS